MLQQAIEQLLRDRGWSVASDGRIVTAQKDGATALVGFLRAADAGPFADRAAESSATLAAVLLEEPPRPDLDRLEEAGVATFTRQEVEDLAVAAFLRRPSVEAARLLQALEHG